jgi:hypothetical protein
MIYKLTSIKEVISKIGRDLGIGERELPWHDIVEWSAEALKHIGTYYQMEPKKVNLVVDNYMAKLPCDFFNLIRVTRTIKAFPKNSVNIDKLLFEAGVTNGDIETNIPMDIIRDLMYVEYDKVDRYDHTGKYMHGNERILNGATNDTIGYNNDYKIHNGTIRTMFQTGFVTIEYLSFPVDCDGFPMVPDHVSFFDALFWRTVYQLNIRGFEFKSRALNDFMLVRSMWNKYCLQARAEANAPDLEMLEQLKNIWLTLKIDNYSFYSDFNEVGRPENFDFGKRI